MMLQFGDYRLAYPFFLFLIALIPIGMWLASSRVKRGTIRFSSLSPFRKLGSSFRTRLRFIVPLLRTCALILLIFALARPQHGTQLAPEESEGIGLLLVLDASPSMDKKDFSIEKKRVRRIDAVKEVAKEFIEGKGDLKGRPQDQIGIITFTGYPIPRAPLTLDHGAILEVVDTIDTPDTDNIERDRRTRRPLYPEEYSTAIGDALARGAQRLKEIELKSKVMILMSDGSNTDGILEPLEAAKIAKAYGVKVYTIGIGQSGTIMEERNTLFGKRMVPVRSDLDEDTLTAIADMTGGQYFNAASTDALRNVYQEIDQLERSEIVSMRYYRWEEQFQAFALIALGLIALEVLLGQTIFRRLP